MFMFMHGLLVRGRSYELDSGFCVCGFMLVNPSLLLNMSWNLLVKVRYFSSKSSILQIQFRSNSVLSFFLLYKSWIGIA